MSVLDGRVEKGEGQIGKRAASVDLYSGSRGPGPVTTDKIVAPSHEHLFAQKDGVAPLWSQSPVEFTNPDPECAAPAEHHTKKQLNASY